MKRRYHNTRVGGLGLVRGSSSRFEYRFSSNTEREKGTGDIVNSIDGQ